MEAFAEWMEDRGEGHRAVKLGAAVPIQDVINKVREARPEVEKGQIVRLDTGVDGHLLYGLS